jgi:TRAP-type uncharacterized transport system fused permease subunit
VTPPVALASYTAAGLAGADSVKTSLAAFRLSLVAFFVPFAFVSEPALLGDGAWWEIALASVVLLAGIACWAGALEAYFSGPIGVVGRVVLGILGLAIIFSPILTWQGGGTGTGMRVGVALAGIVVAGIALGVFHARAKRAAPDAL